MLPILSIFGDFERFVSEDLYPYRYVITPIVLLLLAGAVGLAVSKGVHLILWRHRLATAVVGLPLLGLSVVGGDYFLSPLWERSFLEEASPLEAAAATTTTATTTQRGDFQGTDDFHFGRGEAQIIRTDAGEAILRFEDFSVRNGPDLYVYLSRETGGNRVDESLNLGRLKATDGAFNYTIPAAIDVAEIKSVLIWCRQFRVLFAIAEL